MDFKNLTQDQKDKFYARTVRLNKDICSWEDINGLADLTGYILPVLPETIKLAFKKPSDFLPYNNKFSKSYTYLKKSINTIAENILLEVEIKKIKQLKAKYSEELKKYNSDVSLVDLRKLSITDDDYTTEQLENIDELKDEIENLNEQKKKSAKKLKNVENIIEVKRAATNAGQNDISIYELLGI